VGGGRGRRRPISKNRRPCAVMILFLALSLSPCALPVYYTATHTHINTKTQDNPETAHTSRNLALTKPRPRRAQELVGRRLGMRRVKTSGLGWPRASGLPPAASALGREEPPARARATRAL